MEQFSTADVIAGLDEVWQSVLEATDAMKETSWELPTDCPGWDVSDQVAHLTGVELMLLGEPAPEIELGERDYVKSDFGASMEVWVEARRSLPGKAVRAEFAETTARRLAVLRALPEEAFDEIVGSPIGQVPMRTFMTVRIMDSWIHEQDIRLALGRPGGRNGLGERVTLARVDAALGGIVGKGAAAPEGSSVAFEIDGPLGGRRRLRVENGKARWEEGPEATATLFLSQETFVRRFGGRISSLDALAAPGTVLEGDLELARSVLEALGVMI